MNLRKKLIATIVVLAGLALPASATAHVTVSPTEAPAEGYAMLYLTVPHGCEEAPTTSVSVRMPDQVISATPGVVPGWKIKAVEGKLPNPAEQHGETITEGVRQVTWTGGPLDPEQLEQFPLSVAFAGAEGDAAEFKVVQGCAGGAETAWIQSTPASGEEPEHPAPTVTLDASGEEHGASSGEEDGEESVDAETVSSTGSDEGSGDGLAIAALIVGALGLLVGGTALVTSRRSRR
ncbi:MAG: YcnI family copper-binding membrane protein [Solirubrobacterales bacterium]